MKIKEIFNWVKKIFKVLSLQNIVTLESFSILDNREDLELRQGDIWKSAFIKMFVSLLLIAILSCFKCFIYEIGWFFWLFLAFRLVL